MKLYFTEKDVFEHWLAFSLYTQTYFAVLGKKTAYCLNTGTTNSQGPILQQPEIIYSRNVHGREHLLIV